MSTYTFYPVANREGTIRSDNVTYTTARTGSNLTVNTSLITLTVGQMYAGNLYSIFQPILTFDTTSLPSTASIATLGLSVSSNFLASTDDLRVYSTSATATPMTTASWVSMSTLAGMSGATASVTTSTSSISVSLATSTVNNGSVTTYVCATQRAVTGTTPTGQDYFSFYSADYSTTQLKPVLTVTAKATLSSSFTAAATVWGTATSSLTANSAIKRFARSYVLASSTLAPSSDLFTVTGVSPYVVAKAYYRTPSTHTNDSVDLLRDGTVIKTGLKGTTWNDYAVPFNTAVQYNLRVTNLATGAVTDNLTTLTVASDDWVLCGAFGNVVVTPTDYSAQRLVQSEDFAVLSASYKTVQTGLVLGRSGSLSVVSTSSGRDALINTLRSACDSTSPVYLKDPWGNVAQVAIGPLEFDFMFVGNLTVRFTYTQIG